MGVVNTAKRGGGGRLKGGWSVREYVACLSTDSTCCCGLRSTCVRLYTFCSHCCHSFCPTL